MKNRFLWAGAVVLAATVGSQVQTLGLTNGFVVISSRTASDSLYRQISSSTLYDADDFKGPGVVSPGDAAMAALLQDYGYCTRVVPEWLLSTALVDPQGVYSATLPQYFGPPTGSGEAPDWICGGAGGPTKTGDTNGDYAAQLVIISGSGSSFDMPPPNTRGIPIIMGEHSCLGDRVLNGNSSIYLYQQISSGDLSSDVYPTDPYTLWMQVTAAGKAHPIMQGIPLDSQDRIKIWRDPYPEENAHVPSGGKKNWRYAMAPVNIPSSVVAPGTTVLGFVANDPTKAIFAVMDQGGDFGITIPAGPWAGLTTAPSRLVHLFCNERGSGDARRGFNNLTDIAKVIFIRTCKWAMGETLQPYQPLGLIQVSKLNGSQIQLSWTGTATKNYKILGTTDLLSNPWYWQTVAEDIKGLDGTVTAKLDFSGATQYAFLRVAPMP
jgi:hypothetical protein